MDKELIIMLLKYAGWVIAILFAVFIIAIVTPKLAALIDKKRHFPSRLEKGENIEPKDYKVKDPYGAGEKLEDFDPNYKIYNEDIYGFKRKNHNKSESKNDKQKE